MKGYVVVLCLALASGSSRAQLPEPSLTAAASASASDGGAAAAAAAAGGLGAAGAGSPLPMDALGGAAMLGGMMPPSPNQLMGQTMVTGAQLGSMGSRAGFDIAFQSIGAAEQLGNVVPVFGSPFVSLLTQPFTIGAQLGQSITDTTLNMTRDMGEMIMSDQMAVGGGLFNHLLAAKAAHKLNRLAPPPMLATVAADPLAMTAVGGMSPAFDPTMMMSMGGALTDGATATALAG